MIGRDEVLYRDDLARVTRLWLVDETTSYAIRTLTKVSFVERRAPPITTLFLFFLSVALLFFSCLYLIREIVPAVIAWILIALSLVVLIGSVWFAFVKQPVYLIKAAFLDGSVVKIMRRKRDQAHGLHAAINKAMSMQRFHLSAYEEHVPETLPIEEPVDEIDQAQAVRKRRRMRRVLALLSRDSK